MNMKTQLDGIKIAIEEAKKMIKSIEDTWDNSKRMHERDDVRIEVLTEFIKHLEKLPQYDLWVLEIVMGNLKSLKEERVHWWADYINWVYDSVCAVKAIRNTIIH